ncbi:hypothetical protein H310_03770 [Aphanomyces invadans]|uniref:DUF6818 domain-containing protein n=1 Tax=Aphanomyces invadans TaxID=157072 RepID=A0A024UDQ6_9STRA|nr:hypothetical protein H310_03770 [Aphanomyces invadans]ETW04536.1 hypothetical protein H310_03770 [Aphanomyces invadans]|eukprot:XP_008865974.1 hypothetical protein H310_03770 [Aphanomyces invadans]
MRGTEIGRPRHGSLQLLVVADPAEYLVALHAVLFSEHVDAGAVAKVLFHHVEFFRDESAFNTSPFPRRDVDGLKRKFAQLRNHPKPSGDPTCPSDVVRAKRISRQIDNEAAVLSMKDENDEEDHNDTTVKQTMLITCSSKIKGSRNKVKKARAGLA